MRWKEAETPLARACTAVVLAQARGALQQHVPAGDQGDDQQLQEGGLAHDD